MAWMKAVHDRLAVFGVAHELIELGPELLHVLALRVGRLRLDKPLPAPLKLLVAPMPRIGHGPAEFRIALELLAHGLAGRCSHDLEIAQVFPFPEDHVVTPTVILPVRAISRWSERRLRGRLADRQSSSFPRPEARAVHGRTCPRRRLRSRHNLA